MTLITPRRSGDVCGVCSDVVSGDVCGVCSDVVSGDVCGMCSDVVSGDVCGVCSDVVSGDVCGVCGDIMSTRCRELDLCSPFCVEVEGQATTLYRSSSGSGRGEGLLARSAAKEFSFDYSYWSVNPTDDHFCGQEKVRESTSSH